MLGAGAALCFLAGYSLVWSGVTHITDPSNPANTLPNVFGLGAIIKSSPPKPAKNRAQQQNMAALLNFKAQVAKEPKSITITTKKGG